MLQLGFDTSNRVLVQPGGIFGSFCMKSLRGKAGRGRATAAGRQRVTRQDPALLILTQEPNPALSYNPAACLRWQGMGRRDHGMGMKPLLPQSCPVHREHPPRTPTARSTQIPRGQAGRRRSRRLPVGERELLVGWKQQPYVNEG